MKVVLAGATGYIGRPLTSLLHESGHQGLVLTRDLLRAARWPRRRRPRSGTGAGERLLDGRARGGGRHRQPERGQHRGRAVDGGAQGGALAQPAAAGGGAMGALGALPAERRPRVLVGASGIDYYGDRGDEEVTEESPPGDSFLARLCVQWEAAHREAEPLGLRVVLMRTGVVLGRDAEVVKRLARPFRLFVGGPLGSGRQWLAWVHLDDIVGLYRLAVENEAAQGPLNAVAPDTRRMKDVAQEVGRVLGRPSWAPAPAFALKTALGEQADLVLHGRKAVPQRALALGYQYKYPDLPGALAQALGGA